MLFVVRFFPEMTIKTRPVRQRLIKALRRNLRLILGRVDLRVSVTGDWDILEVETHNNDENLAAQVVDILRNTSGISLISRVSKQPLPDFDYILAGILPFYRDRLQGRSFAVRSKRQGNHDFSSMDLDRYLGTALLRETGASKVDLQQPDVTVRVEIRQQTLYVVEDQWRGLGGKEHELAVKEVAVYLWMRFGSSHRVKFVSVPFEALLGEILAKVDSGLMGVVLKRIQDIIRGIMSRLHASHLKDAGHTNVGVYRPAT